MAAGAPTLQMAIPDKRKIEGPRARVYVSWENSFKIPFPEALSSDFC